MQTQSPNITQDTFHQQTQKEASQEMEEYFSSINNEVLHLYNIANQAKKKGYDPELEVPIPLAKNMAERVEGLISTVAKQVINSGMVERIKELEHIYKKQSWIVAFKIAEEVAQEKFCTFKDKKEAIEVALRVGMAYLTVGVVASPIEGFTRIEFKKRMDNRDYLCLYFSGPIRSAGTTAVCVFIALADYLKEKFKLADYDPSEEEIKRHITEIYDFHERITNLQYLPSEEEIYFIVKNLPIQIDGDPTEKIEVSNFKDLPRIETNKLRNGTCLVIAESLCQKASKFFGKFKLIAPLLGIDLERFSFFEEFILLQKKMRAGKQIESSIILPDFHYIKDIVAGRPILSYPQRQGGFRLRYGRARNSGFSSAAIHPTTMYILDDYIAIGTQLKTERPGKSTIIASCDKIEPPIVKLSNGSVIKIKTLEQAKSLSKDISEILYLGDILISFGDFLVRSHRLLPQGFSEEYWRAILEDKLTSQQNSQQQPHQQPEQPQQPHQQPHQPQQNQLTTATTILTYSQHTQSLLQKAMQNPHDISIEEATFLSEQFQIPLHPKFIFFWNAISGLDFLNLIHTLKSAVFQQGKLIIPDLNSKRQLELIGIEHKAISNEYILIEGEEAQALFLNLGISSPAQLQSKQFSISETSLEMINQLSSYQIMDKLGTFIGARMGRPEKAKIREMKGSPNVLFPIGKEGGKMRSFQSAIEKGAVTAEFPIFFCASCNKETISQLCYKCNSKTQKLFLCSICAKQFQLPCEKHSSKEFKLSKINIQEYYTLAMQKISLRNPPQLVKGVRGLSSKDRTPEHIAKGLLRAKHSLPVNKDGTIRYDMTEAPLTHFKPEEISTPIEKLKQLGYTHDIFKNPLENPSQILELKPQDIVLPSCPTSPDESCDKVLFRIAQFIDELLIKLYSLQPYYNLKSPEDLVGHLIVAMSPHTSAGIIGRILGFSKTQVLYAHPLFHSIMRRDCDGDEAGVILLLDCLINFSRKYLPNTRGATQDSPLVITSRLIASEVDDMVFDMDICSSYPYELYKAAEKYSLPSSLLKTLESQQKKLEKLGDFLGTPRQYESLMFTHDTENINAGTQCSVYKTIPKMEQKVTGQMLLAKKIRAVDEDDVARLIIERHFIRDIKGNLRKFSSQNFRCSICNEIYRRVPLKGKCLKCRDGRIIFTISESSITKYLKPTIQLANSYNLPQYLKEVIMLTKERVDSLFGKEPERQQELNVWF